MGMIQHGDALDLLRSMPTSSVDAIVTDPPYGLDFMGKSWDKTLPNPMIWSECKRVLKPGAHMVAFGAPRLYHRLGCQIEDAGLELRDLLMWLFGSGFPKNHKISNGMDRHRNDEGEIRQVCRFLRASMEARAVSSAALAAHFGVHSRMVDHWAARDTDSQPTLPTWEQWIELVCFLVLDKLPNYEDMHALCWRLNGRKGTPGEAWGQREVIGHRSRNAITGATDILAGAGTEWDITLPASDEAQAWDGWGTALKPAYEPITLARKSFRGSSTANVRKHGTGAINVGACLVGGERHPANLILDPMSALALAEATGNPVDRFFYCAKTSRAEREMGLEYRKRRNVNDGRATSIDNPFQRGDTQRANVHPTVKPVALMRWLCRLITPPGGLVLDPFCGSGSTGIAAALEGFSFVGYELDAEYVEIAEARIWHAISNPSAYDPELNPADEDERQIRIPGT